METKPLNKELPYSNGETAMDEEVVVVFFRFACIVGKAHNFPNGASENGPLSKAYFTTQAKRGSSPLDSTSALDST
jgi:hypothetical protein